MSAMREQASRLRKLLCCAPTAQALAADLVAAVGGAAGARAYIHELRAEFDGIFDALDDEIDRHDTPPTHTEGRHD